MSLSLEFVGEGRCPVIRYRGCVRRASFHNCICTVQLQDAKTTVRSLFTPADEQGAALGIVCKDGDLQMEIVLNRSILGWEPNELRIWDRKDGSAEDYWLLFGTDGEFEVGGDDAPFAGRLEIDKKAFDACREQWLYEKRRRAQAWYTRRKRPKHTNPGPR